MSLCGRKGQSCAARTGARRLRFSPAARRPIRRRGSPRCGAGVDFVARVGAADVESETARFTEIGVTPHLVGDPDRETGRLIALIDPDGERSFLTDRGANEALEARDIPDALIASASHISLSGYSFFAPSPRAAVLDVMRRAGDKPISVDPASAEFLREVGADNFLAWTKGATILFPNEEEAAVLAGSTDPETQCARLAKHYPLVVIKRGAAGAEAMEGGRRWRIKAPKVEVVDTTGAGDAFVAGFSCGAADRRGHSVALGRASADGAAAFDNRRRTAAPVRSRPAISRPSPLTIFVVPLFVLRYPATPRPAKPISISAQTLGSGTPPPHGEGVWAPRRGCSAVQSANVALAQSMETCGSTKAENDPVGPGKLPSRLPVAWMKTEKMCPLEGELSTKVLNAKAPDPHPEGSAVGEQVNSPPGINPTVPCEAQLEACANSGNAVPVPDARAL